MRKVFCLIFLSTGFCIAQTHNIKTIVIDYDVRRNEIIGFDYYNDSEKIGFAQNHDTLKYESATNYDKNGYTIKVRNYYNYVLTDSIIRTKRNDTTNTLLTETTDKMPCNTKNIICIHNKEGQLTEKKVFEYRHKFIFKSKKIIFWHKYFYLKNFRPCGWW